MSHCCSGSWCICPNDIHSSGGLAATDVTVEVLTPIVANIKAEISAGVGKLSALNGQDAEIIMASVDGSAQISVSALAQLVATLIIVSLFVLISIHVLSQTGSRMSSVHSVSFLTLPVLFQSLLLLLCWSLLGMLPPQTDSIQFPDC